MENKKLFITQEVRKEMLKNFIVLPKNCDDLKYTIYMISNNYDNKLYIGKTSNIKTRALNYLNAVENGNCYSDLIKDMMYNGIHNFHMTILENASTEESASIKEKYYIDKYNAIFDGYNTFMASPNASKRGRKYGSPQTLHAKLAKSKLIACVNPYTNEIIFSTGLKLFGDFIDRNKDDIKSAAKRQGLINNYFIFYLNKIDFMNQLSMAKSKSDAKHHYLDNNATYLLFIKCSEKLIHILESELLDTRNIKFITQTDSNPSGYEYGNPDEFIKYYKTLAENILDNN